MIQRIRARALLVPVFFVTACGGDLFGPRAQSEIILFQIQGRVTSTADSSPIVGASVVLGGGGYFSFPSPLKTGITDDQGHYLIEHTATISTCAAAQIWLSASAAGFQFTDKGFDLPSVLRPNCVTGFQTFNIALKPNP
jgi:hypothetical protein